MPPRAKPAKQGEEITPEWYAQVKRAVGQDREQVELAKRRMGRTPAALLRWVVDFAQTDLDVLRPEERQAKGYDLRVLPELVKSQRPRQPAKSGQTQGGAYEVGPMSEEILRRIHTDVADGLRKLFDGESWKLPNWDTCLYRSSPKGAAQTRFGLLRQLDNEPETVLSAVIDLILEAGGKLRACPQCRRVFVSVRRQAFCSTEHAQRARNQKKYESRLKKMGRGVVEHYRRTRKAGQARTSRRA